MSAPAAKPLSTDRRHTTAHNPETIDTATTHPATASEKAPSHATETARVPTRRGGDTATDTKPATGSPTRSGEGANGTNTPKHSAPGKAREGAQAPQALTSGAVVRAGVDSCSVVTPRSYPYHEKASASVRSRRLGLLGDFYRANWDTKSPGR
jgi:hypothetical protein